MSRFQPLLRPLASSSRTTLIPSFNARHQLDPSPQSSLGSVFMISRFQSTSQQASSSPSSSSSTTAESSLQKPYFVERTKSGELPVYTDIRNGGNNCRTVVRKIKGNVHALQAELNEFFRQGHMDPLKPAPVVTMRPTNKHLEVRGRWVEEVKSWLEARGF